MAGSLEFAARLAVFAVGAAIAAKGLSSAIRTFVLPRATVDPLPRVTFLVTRVLFDVRLRYTRGYDRRDRVMALYAPMSLILLEGVWLATEVLGFTMMYWGAGVRPVREAFAAAGSAVFTLGFREPLQSVTIILAFFGAAIGLVLVALLVAYLPTMYTAFARRETAVAMLDLRAGSPPSGVELLARCAAVEHASRFRRRLNDMWSSWETWFTDIEESHTSLTALSFFRSPQAQRSWVVAAGAVLDGAALATSALAIPRDVQAGLCLRAGFRALVQVADHFQLVYDDSEEAPISVTRAEFDAAVDRLDRAGLPVVEDLDDAWRAFSSWRRRYDGALLGLADLTMAPEAPWSSDRSAGRAKRPFAARLRPTERRRGPRAPTV